MANDWIKIRKDLPEDKHVLAISRVCEISVAETVLALIKFWRWVDTNSADGEDLPVTREDVDRLVSVPRFSSALEDRNWIKVGDKSVSIPDFDTHLSSSAKKRAQNLKAKNQSRQAVTQTASSECPPNVPPARGQSGEQRREEKKKERSTSLSLAQTIYQAYPRHVGKAKALPAIDNAIKTIAEREGYTKREAAAWLLCRVEKFADSPAGKRGTFTPHPTTWMNGGRYDDDDAEWQRTDDGPGGRNAAQDSKQRGQDGGRQRRAARLERELVGNIGQARSL